jgi:hypothetical protein
LGPLVASLQVSAELPSDGVSVDVHEKPNEPPLQPATVESGAQLLVVVAIQQKRELPLLSLTPAPHDCVASESAGVSAPLHE